MYNLNISICATLTDGTGYNQLADDIKGVSTLTADPLRFKQDKCDISLKKGYIYISKQILINCE